MVRPLQDFACYSGTLHVDSDLLSLPKINEKISGYQNVKKADNSGKKKTLNKARIFKFLINFFSNSIII